MSCILMIMITQISFLKNCLDGVCGWCMQGSQLSAHPRLSRHYSWQHKQVISVVDVARLFFFVWFIVSNTSCNPNPSPYPYSYPLPLLLTLYLISLFAWSYTGNFFQKQSSLTLEKKNGRMLLFCSDFLYKYLWYASLKRISKNWRMYF